MLCLSTSSASRLYACACVRHVFVGVIVFCVLTQIENITTSTSTFEPSDESALAVANRPLARSSR